MKFISSRPLRGLYQSWHARDHLSNFGIQHLASFLAERLGETTVTLLGITIRDGADDFIHAVVGTSLENRIQSDISIDPVTGLEYPSLRKPFG